MKKASKVFKSIRFAKMDPNHDKGPKGSSDDEEHYAVSSQEFQQQVDHVKKRAMQEAKIKVNFKMPPESPAERIAREHAARRKASGLPDPSHYKQMAAQKQKEIDAMKEEVEELEEGRTSQRHPLEGHEYHKKTNAELEYIAKDAHKAAEAMKGHNTTAENKYRDQANDSATVRYFRKKSGTPDWYKKKYGLKEEVKDEYARKVDKYLKQKYYSPPFDKPYKKSTGGTVTDKSGAKHTPMSRARNLAKTALKKYDTKVSEANEMKGEDPCWKGYQMVGMKKKGGKKVPNCVPESVQIDESRKAQIVREAVKKAKEKNKSNDKFEPEPELNSQVQKVDNV